MVKIKDHDGLVKGVTDVKLQRRAQPEYLQNAIICVLFKDTTFSYFEENTDPVEVYSGLPYYFELKRALQTVLNTFGRTDGVCVTTQTKQHVLHEIRELLERLEHE